MELLRLGFGLVGVCSVWLEFPYTTELHIHLSLISSFPFFLFLYFFQSFGEIFCSLSLEAYSHFDSGVWNSEAGGRAGGRVVGGRQDRQTGRQVGRQADRQTDRQAYVSFRK